MNSFLKKKIRNFYIAKRIKIQNKEKKNLEINNRVINFFKKKKRNIISGYCPVKGEVNPFISLNKLHNLGHLICLPEIVQKDQKLIFKSWDQHTKMKIGKFGIQVPLSKKVVIPNYLLVPIVSCDLFKNRLGYGGGYYDRTLSYLKNKNHCLSIGLAYDEQINESIPSEKFDQKLDIIITQSMIIN